MDRIFEMGINIKNKLNLTKIGGSKMEGFPQMGPPKIQTF